MYLFVTQGLTELSAVLGRRTYILSFLFANRMARIKSVFEVAVGAVPLAVFVKTSSHGGSEVGSRSKVYDVRVRQLSASCVRGDLICD